MFLVPIRMVYFHAENHQCSEILDYKLSSIRKQPDDLERERSSGELIEWRPIYRCIDNLKNGCYSSGTSVPYKI